MGSPTERNSGFRRLIIFAQCSPTSLLLAAEMPATAANAPPRATISRPDSAAPTSDRAPTMTAANAAAMIGPPALSPPMTP